MVTGKIIRFDEARGYGFIAPDGGGEDVFVHANDLLEDKRALVPGVSVEFDISEAERGLKASSVRLVRRPAAGGQASQQAGRDDGQYGLEDVLSAAELRQELTETLLEAAPTLTGGQILQVRQGLEELAHKHGWVES
ncbi:MAG TPA: cold shock domain-containing protein [Actinomycetes bacterium]|nr:cold shock domain-containing protein [Actinomycetes bacterium]